MAELGLGGPRGRFPLAEKNTRNATWEKTIEISCRLAYPWAFLAANDVRARRWLEGFAAPSWSGISSSRVCGSGGGSAPVLDKAMPIALEDLRLEKFYVALLDKKRYPLHNSRRPPVTDHLCIRLEQ